MNTAETSSKVKSLLGSALIWDNHGCLPLRADDSFLPQLERYRQAGFTVVSINVGFGTMSWPEHLRVLSFMRQWIAQRPEKYCLVSGIRDALRCKADGRLGIVFDVEGMTPVQHDLSMVQTLYELGVRWMLVAYNNNNLAGGGCLDPKAGLTDVGRAIIDEMERVGMVLCVSHTSARAAAEALEYSRNPVIFSHSNPSAVTAHYRNISDDLMRACASKGGVIGLNGIGPFLGGDTSLVNRLLDHIRYAIDLVGPEHVGLGLDYVFDRDELDEYLRLNPAMFPGMEPSKGVPMIEPEALSAIVEGLAREKLTDMEIWGILGENWLRVASRVWH